MTAECLFTLYVVYLCSGELYGQNFHIFGLTPRLWHMQNFFFFLSIFFYSSLLFVYFWLCWIFVALFGLSLVAVSRGRSLVLVHGLLLSAAYSVHPWCASFSSCSMWTQWLWLVGSRAWAHWLWAKGPVSLRREGSPRPGIKPAFPALAGGSHPLCRQENPFVF